MAMEQYSQEPVSQNAFLKQNEASLDKWKLSSESIDESENSPSGGFDCNICLDSVQDPVVTLCGHLYCWPCIYKWIHHQNSSSETHNKHPQCPVCKNDISQKTLVPLYGRGQTTKSQSDDKKTFVVPRRPPGQTCGAYTVPSQQLAPGTTTFSNFMINPMSPTTGMLEEMVSGRIFGNTQVSFYAYPNSYNLVPISTQRARRQAMQADQSLGRVCFFLFCCIMLCLILF